MSISDSPPKRSINTQCPVSTTSHHTTHPGSMESTKIPDEFPFQAPAPAEPLRKIILVAAIAAGIQFGWALQLSLLTPYVQLLGIPHTWASFIWLCGPVSGLIVQPIVGYYSDNCRSSYGRRRPFIAGGAALVAVAVGLIGFAADIGHAAGDTLGNRPKPRAITVFVVGFWILDVANNTLQGPCRALLADMSGGCAKKMSTANALYSFFMAVGNVLGYAAGSYSRLYRVFPFTKTLACDVYCANLKSCLFIAIALLTSITAIAVSIVRETAIESPAASKKGRVPVFGELFSALKELPKPMWILLLVLCLTAIALFPFMLFDTDWMGREVYGGVVQTARYNQGVHAGALGLMLNSVVLGMTSLAIQFGARGLRGAKKLWGAANFLLAICLALTVVVTKQAEHHRRPGAPVDPSVKAGALVLFAVLGIPFSVAYSVPYALASIISSNSKSGQGLAQGVLNLAIVIPQMFVSVVSGPWDGLFGGGNLPAFVAGAVAAAAAAVLALTVLPTPPAAADDADVSKAMTGGGLH